TAANLALLKAAIRDECGYVPSSKSVWKDLQDCSISRNVWVFLWKGIHGGHKIGDYFRAMPEPWRGKGMCPSCGVVESMEHILFVCPDSGQEVIWGLVKNFLARKKLDIDVNMGLVWGSASFRAIYAPNTDSVSRAFRIVVSESAFLAWKIRCERRIEHGDDVEWRLDDDAVQTRWQDAMKKRVCQDYRLLNRRIYGRFAVKRYVVKETWADLFDETA
ncbi:hypothetical protein AURDEDRAFT_20743, partial [Auricularia subglabra TFB-10046 SS5]